MRLWFERGFKAKPKGYEIMKIFSPYAFLGQSGGIDDSEKYTNDMRLLYKFYQKYPEVKYFPQASRLNMQFGGSIQITHPAAVFIKKQRQLINKGYTEQKSFEIVEEDLGKFINQQKEEQRILRGLAINTFGNSYLDRFQQVAEQESTQKVKRMERDIPKYLRAQEDWMKDLNQKTEQGTEQQQKNEDISYERQSIEDLLLEDDSKPFKDQDPVRAYQPVLYQIVKDPSLQKEREGLTSIQEGFIQRTERLLQIFHQRTHIHDGLKNLSDKEVLQKVREGPTKLKKSAKSLLYKLKKYNVKLDKNGDIDYSQVKEQNVVNTLKQNEKMVKLTLMQSDLEFEYPQKLEKMMVKADILKMLDDEEDKLKSLAQQKEMEEMQKKVLTYEEYYSANPASETQTIRDTGNLYGSSRRDTKFETFVQQQASKYIFDNDVLEQAYKFWENDEDKYERLKKIWIDLKRKNALGGVEARTRGEQDGITSEIVQLTRKIRHKIDQELTRRNVEPIFKENYRAYDKEEFLLDSDIEFFKIKKLLEKNPNVLKEDPLIGIDYLKIINLIKRKKLVETTSNEFAAEDSIDSTYLDIKQIDKDLYMRKLKENEKLEKELMQDVAASKDERLALDDQETEQSIRANKKREERDKTKLLKQFDQLAQSYEKNATSIINQKKSETAGDLKKKNKKKKEKSLGAKLRLKEKKGGPAK